MCVYQTSNDLLGMVTWSMPSSSEIREIEKMIRWLRDSGMTVNEAKDIKYVIN